jgi:hypothetical protein
MVGLIFGATNRIAYEATVARQQHDESEGSHELPEDREPRLLFRTQRKLI